MASASALLGLLDLVSTLVCIRLWVTPADFGTATLAMALFPIVDRLGGMMLGAALVRDPDLGSGVGGGAGGPGFSSPNGDAEPTVFWLQLVQGTAVLGLLVAARPLIALAIQPIGASMLCAYALRLVLQAAGVVPEARMRRALRFGELSAIRVIAGLVDTAVKLGLAYAGEPIWCFAVGPVANTIVSTIALQLREAWRPRAAFDRAAAVRALRFAGALSGGELLYYAYTSADYLAVGVYFGDAAVGAYRLAYELVLDVVKLVSSITAEVAYPVFVRRGDVAGDLLRFTRQNAFALAPVLVFFALEADRLLALLYGPLPPAAATAARILCAVGALRICSFVLPSMLAGIGAARRVLVYHLVALAVLPAAFAIAGHFGSDFTAVAWAWAAGYPIAFAALLAMALPRAQLTLGAYARALGKTALCATIAAIAGYGARVLVGNPLVVAVVVLAVYALLLARLEGVTPRAVVRAITAPAPGTAPPPGT